MITLVSTRVCEKFQFRVINRERIRSSVPSSDRAIDGREINLFRSDDLGSSVNGCQICHEPDHHSGVVRVVFRTILTEPWDFTVRHRLKTSDCIVNASRIDLKKI